LVQRALRGFEPFRVGDRQQGGLVFCGDEIEFSNHSYLNFSVRGIAGTLEAAAESPLAFICMPEAATPCPRFFLMLSMPRVTGPRLEQKSKAFSSVISPFS